MAGNRKNPMKTILITGGAGFVGSSIGLSIKQDEHDVRVIAFDNLIRKGSEMNLPRLKDAGVEFVRGDIRNPDDIASIWKFDIIYECAAEPSVLAGRDGNPSYVIQANLVGTLNCLEAARLCEATFVFLSTSRVYPYGLLNNLDHEESDTRFVLTDANKIKGASSKGISEQFDLSGVRSLYGATKLASELIIQEYCEMYGLKAIINRCGVLAGPWQMGKVDQGFVALWIANHIYGLPLKYIGYEGKGKQVRDILHPADLYALIKMQLKNIEKFSGQIFNVGGGLGNSVSLMEMTAISQDVSGRQISITQELNDRPGDVRTYITDCAKIQSLTGWSPTRSVKEIAEETANWMTDNKTLLQPVFCK